jgi:hypothetical protein
MQVKAVHILSTTKAADARKRYKPRFLEAGSAEDTQSDTPEVQVDRHFGKMTTISPIDSK